MTTYLTASGRTPGAVGSFNESVEFDRMKYRLQWGRRRMTADEADSSRSTHIDSAQLRRVSAGSLIGTAIEWYDYFIYGLIAALAFNELFFPPSTPPWALS